MESLPRTIFYDRHVALGAKVVEFGGWEMPVQYPPGIVQEHLATRRTAGLFDVSHMGRLVVSGKNRLPFLQHVLSNDAATLEIGQSQYTIIPDDDGGAIDDAYLYRYEEDAYLLVVNASNREKDWEHLKDHAAKMGGVEMVDRTFETAMLSLQGPGSEAMISRLMENGALPEPRRNLLSEATLCGAGVRLARTGYTGEPVCFELFMENKDGLVIWDALIAEGAQPVGLGARDTLRLEAALPLYGHELGEDPENRQIPVFAMPLSRFAVSFAPLKGDFVGRAALEKQFSASKKISAGDFSTIEDLPRRIMPVALEGKGVARAGYAIFRNDDQVGFITSGTMVPYWHTREEGAATVLADSHGLRGICLALVDSGIDKGDNLDVEMRGRRIPAVVVHRHLRNATPYAVADLWN